MAKNKKGMTLITIMVSILVMILILSAIVVSANNILSNTKKQQFARELDLVQSSWKTYLARNSSKVTGFEDITVDISLLTAEEKAQYISEYKPDNKVALKVINLEEIDVENVTYGNGTALSKDRYLVSLTTGKVYYEKGIKIDGKTYYTTTETKAEEIDIDTTVPTITAKAGTSTSSTITINAIATDSGGSGIKASSYKYSKDNGVNWTEPTNETSYTYTGLTTGAYMCKVQVANNVGKVSTSTVISISTTQLGAIELQSSLTSWTNTNVTVTISYPEEITTEQYSLDGTNWSTYTTPLDISANITVYAKGLDLMNNETAVATLVVSNIDKIAPIVTASSGGVTATSITVNASASDAGSGLKVVSYEYSKDNGVSWTAPTNAASYTYTGVTTGAYQCKARVSDNALNSTTSAAVTITTISISASPTTWTNGTVYVTVTYPPETVTKQYSKDNGTTWLTYTTPIAITENSTIVSAKGIDSVGTKSEASLTVSNIDITAPVISPVFAGTMIYTDPTFASGSNGTNTYNNSGNGNVIKTRMAMETPTGSGYGLEIKTIGTSSPECGGFYFNTPTSANKIYVTRIIAKIPVGCTINFASNPTGTGGSGAWLTPTTGTGNWEEYEYRLTCGSTGTFSTTNYYYIRGLAPTVASPLIWYVAYATVFDATNWGITNTAVIPATDSSGIAGYGVNQSAVTPPTYTDVSTASPFIAKTFNITGNGTYYAWVKDVYGYESSKVFTVSYVDNIAPTVTASNAGSSTSSAITVNAVAADTGGSGLNTASYQYSKDNGTTWTAVTSATSYTYTGLTTGTYQCKVKVADIAGNSTTSSATAIATTGVGAITLAASPSTWTNSNVAVTITYPTEITTKQYSLDGTNWSTYTTALSISTNGTTVYAKGLDVAGNQAAQATLTVANIDKTIPTVAYGTNGGSGLSQASTTVTLSDAGGSLLNTATLNYVWDTQGVTAPVSGWTTFSNGATLTKVDTGSGTYYLWIKGSDNAGNILTTISNSFTIEVALNKTYSGATTGFAYNNPVIPADFTALTTTDANWTNLSTDWDKGLVIQDVNGSQFVWVPVNASTVTYAKWCTVGISHASTTNDALPATLSETTETAQITKYGGFYIARYEPSFEYNGGNIRAVSKISLNKSSTNWSTTRNNTYNGYLWNYINYTDAKFYSEAMYNTSNVKSGLITGKQWDTTMKWIQNSGKNVTTNSTTWANYYNSASPANVAGCGNLQISGYSEMWKSKNIYDLAGNTFEWTSEIYSNPILRGNIYGYYAGTITAAGSRINLFSSSFTLDYATFRPVLYIL